MKKNPIENNGRKSLGAALKEPKLCTNSSGQMDESLLQKEKINANFYLVYILPPQTKATYHSIPH